MSDQSSESRNPREDAVPETAEDGGHELFAPEDMSDEQKEAAEAAGFEFSKESAQGPEEQEASSEPAQEEASTESADGGGEIA